MHAHGLPALPDLLHPTPLPHLRCLLAHHVAQRFRHLRRQQRPAAADVVQRQGAGVGGLQPWRGQCQRGIKGRREEVQKGRGVHAAAGWQGLLGIWLLRTALISRHGRHSLTACRLCSEGANAHATKDACVHGGREALQGFTQPSQLARCACTSFQPQL